MLLSTPIHILLGEDDPDDCAFFNDALAEIPLTTRVTVVHNGEQVMKRLTDPTEDLPNVIFLDLNMPRQNGFECLLKIKHQDALKHLPVIIISTSYKDDITAELFKNGAKYFIRKPNNFTRFKNLINKALTLTFQTDTVDPLREQFVLSDN